MSKLTAAVEQRIREFARMFGVSGYGSDTVVDVAAAAESYIPQLRSANCSDFEETGRVFSPFVKGAASVLLAVAAGKTALYLLGGVLSGFTLSAAAALISIGVFLYLLSRWVLPGAVSGLGVLREKFDEFSRGLGWES